jgi:branched-chain amino acid transport system permease protein
VTLALIKGRRGALAGAVLLALGLVLPFVPGVYIVFAIDLVCFALAAVALDVLLGFTGLLSFGHALFWGGAGYVATLLIAHGVTSFPIAILAGVVYACVLSVVVGALSVRRSGIFFAMITLAIAEIQYFVVFQMSDLTGGENGLPVQTRGTFFGLPLENDVFYYYVALAALALGVAFAVRVVTSPFGAVLAAMRENEVRAKSIGYDTGTLAGLAGALYTLGNRFAGTDGVDWHTSGAIVIMTILGGIGTIFGPVVGAALYQSLDFFVSKTAIGDKTNLVMGLIFAVVILVARRGLVGEILHATFGKRAPLVEREEI